MDEIFSPMPIGIAAGLFIGKQLGIFSAVWLAVKTGFAARPRGATLLQIYAVAVICGIGFTMSLFIGGLAFSDPLLLEDAKLGSWGGSGLADRKSVVWGRSVSGRVELVGVRDIQ